MSVVRHSSSCIAPDRSACPAAENRVLAVLGSMYAFAARSGIVTEGLNPARRIEQLRHTYASFGAGGGLDLPIISELLGHTQASTTQRYARLDADPLRQASEAIAGRIAAALDGRRTGSVVQLESGRRR